MQQVQDWHRISVLQKQVRELEIVVARLEQLLSGKSAEPAPAPKRSLMKRLFRKP